MSREESAGQAGGGDLRMVLRPAALFSKRDGSSDYAWLRGGGLPRELAAACEHLAELSQVPVALAAGAGGQVWLARAFREGRDFSFRPIVVVEVLAVVEPSGLLPEDLLRLASTSFGWEPRARDEAFPVSVSPVRLEPARLDPDLLARTRLGLPVSVSPPQVVALVRQTLWRYSGICFALPQSHPPPAWRRELSPYVCVDFGEPVLEAMEREALESVLAAPPSEEEWRALDRLSPAEAMQARAWLGSGAPAQGALAPALHPWLVEHLAAAGRGAKLLAAVDRILGDELADELLPAIAPDLSPEALSLLAAARRGQEVRFDRRTADELARGGYLSNPVPLRLWAEWAGASPELTRSALEYLETWGVEPAAAGFLLDLDPEGEETSVAGHLAAAAATAAALRLPPPRRRLVEELRRVSSREELDQLAGMARPYGPWGESLSRLAREGGLEPGSGALAPAEMVAALVARRRALDERWGLETTLGALLAHGRAEEAAELLAAVAGEEGLAPEEAVLAVVRSRLRLAPPAPPPGVEPLRRLAGLGLARPEDIVPEPGEELASLASYAELWPETSRWARLLRGEGGEASGLPRLAAPWLPAVRAAVVPWHLERWLSGLSGEEASRVRSWAVDLLRLTGAPALWEQAPLPQELASLDRLLPWAPALLAPEPPPVRLSVLAALAGSGLLEGDVARAAAWSAALLGPAKARARALALHALCGRGAFPSLAGVPGDLIAALSPVLDALELVNALFRVEEPVGDKVAKAVAARLQESGAPFPSDGYLPFQIDCQPVLAKHLAACQGWEALAPDLETRRRWARRYLRWLDLSPRDLLKGEAETETAGEGEGTKERAIENEGEVEDGTDTRGRDLA